MNKKEIDISLAIELYDHKKLPATKVAPVVGCSIATLLKLLRQHGINIRNSGYVHKKVELDDIKKDYASGMSTTKIANKYGMSPTSIWQRLSKNGVDMRDRKESATESVRKIPKSEHQKICNRYLNNSNENASDISQDYGVHKTTIADILKDNNCV